MSHSKLFKVALLLALFIATGWYTLGYYYSYQPPMCEPDAMIYLQYARNMAEGHPFEYVQGDTPTTGCTSYLYPALLAGLYKIGCSGQRLLTACFFLNGAFYLACILLIGLIARKLAPRMYPFALFAAVLSGQSVYTFFGQTDMGMLMTLFLFCFWAFLSDRRIWLLVGTVLIGLAHPTAAALAGGLIATGGLQAFLAPGTLRRKLAFKNTWPAWIGFAGVITITATLLSNYLLTGDPIFMSLRSKGLFNLYAPMGAVAKTTLNLTMLLKGVIFGLDNSNFRPLFFFPLLTGLAACAGLLLRPWGEPKKVRFEYFLLLTVAAELLLLSTNNQQALSHDRYMAWIIPLLLIYAAVFLETLRNKPALKHTAPALGTALLLFQIISFTFFSTQFAMSCDLNARFSRFTQDVVADLTEPGDRIMFEGGAGQMWYLPERKIVNPFGIFSAEFARGRHWLGYVEILKYHPELRADYWLLLSEELRHDLAYYYFLGDELATDTDALSQSLALTLYRADWSSINPAPPEVPGEWILKDQLDIGYYKDEKRCRYHTHTRLRSVKMMPCVNQDKEANLIEIGEVVIGHEIFQLKNITPNRPLHVILRTALKTRTFLSHYQTMDYPNYKFSSPVKLTVYIDEQPVEVSLEIKEKGFSDVNFTIPADYIQSENPKITVAGDHLTYGYWFYQKCE